MNRARSRSGIVPVGAVLTAGVAPGGDGDDQGTPGGDFISEVRQLRTLSGEPPGLWVRGAPKFR